MSGSQSPRWAEEVISELRRAQSRHHSHGEPNDVARQVNLRNLDANLDPKDVVEICERMVESGRVERNGSGGYKPL